MKCFIYKSDQADFELLQDGARPCTNVKQLKNELVRNKNEKKWEIGFAPRRHGG